MTFNSPIPRQWFKLDQNTTTKNRHEQEIPRDGRGYLDVSGFNPGVGLLCQLQDLAVFPCLVLLGEAGFGKTTVIEREIKRLQAASTSEPVLYLNLRSITGRADLQQDVFQHKDVQDWLAGTGSLTLWLDGLDECPWQLENAMDALLNSISSEWKPYLCRLRLRVVSRPLAWNESFTGRLREMWKNVSLTNSSADDQELELATSKDGELVHRCALCPLSAQDVLDFAAASGLDAEDFRSQIERLSVHALAQRPRTLILLATRFKNGELSTQSSVSRADLFLSGVRQCCEDTPSRRNAGLKSRLLPDEKLAIASRLAAFSIICGRPLLCTESDAAGDPTERELSFGEVVAAFASSAPSVEATPGLNPLRYWDETREVLDTALFDSSEVEDSYGGRREIHWFSQRTDAEFLAARFLDECGASDTQILSLLCHSVSQVPGWDAPRIVPQLVEVAAWTASLRPGVRSVLLERDPRALLRCDLSSWASSEVGHLIVALLQQIQAEKFFDDAQLRLDYERLNNLELASQLAPFIFDAKFSIFTRRTAIDIAESCPAALSLAPRLAALALDPASDIIIRIQAAYAVVKMPDDAAKEALRPLALTPPADDTSNELQGCAFWALWPAHLSAYELFSVLQPPKDELVGAFRTFLWKLPETLRDEDLPVALAWCAKQRHSLYDRGEGYSFDWSKLMRGLFNWAGFALAKEDSPKELQQRIARAWAAALATRFRCHDLSQVWGVSSRSGSGSEAPTLPEGFSCLSDEARRQVVAELVKRLRARDQLRFLILSHGTPLWLYDRDFSWVLEQVSIAPNAKMARAWIQLALLLFQSWGLWADADFSAFLDEALNSPSNPYREALSEAFDSWLAPMPMNDEKAQNRRKEHRSWQEFEQEQQKHKDQAEQDEQRTRERVVRDIEKRLQECEAGDPQVWWMADFALIHDREPNQALGELSSHLNESRAWKDADEAQRERLRKAAQRYLEECSPISFPRVPANWQTSSTFFRPLAAAHRALLLLFLEDRVRFDTFSDDVLQRWAPVVVWFPWMGGEIGEEDNSKLLQAVTERVPEAVAYAVEIHIQRDAAQHGCVFALRKVEFFWPEALTKRLMALVQDPKLSPVAVSSILNELLRRESLPLFALRHTSEEAARIASEKAELPAHQLARELFEAAFNFSKRRTQRTRSQSVKRPQQKKEQSSQRRPDATYTHFGERAAEIALALLGSAYDGGWNLVWRALQQDPSWGEQVMLDYSSRFDVRGKALFVQFLSEEELASWFLWLYDRFPTRSDERVMGAHFISPREQLADVRDSLLRQLQNRQTPVAVAELARIKEKLPDHWAKYILPETLQMALAASWQPPKPKELARLLQSQDKRFISSGEEFLDVVVESLQRAQEKLHGEIPLAFVLWDKVGERVEPSAPSPSVASSKKSTKCKTVDLWQPKDEESLSDWVAAHLRDDLKGRGLVVNREVVIRRTRLNTRGERVDIHLDLNPSGSSPHAPDSLHLIIEVKGNWNPELPTAMKEQLRDRYLKKNSCRYGLYLIGWFDTKDWHQDKDRPDSRRNQCPTKNLQDIEAEYADQAKTLSTAGVALRSFVLDTALTHQAKTKAKASSNSTAKKNPARKKGSS